MKTKLSVSICILFLGLTFFSCKPSDEKLSLQIKEVLTASQPDIASEVKEGVVTLTGVVSSPEEKAAAEALIQTIKDVKGIKSVVNSIEVKVPEPVVVINPDDVLKKSITEGFAVAGFKDIVIEAMNGEVTLTGNVKKADLQKVMQIANESKPMKVNNKLTIVK